MFLRDSRLNEPDNVTLELFAVLDRHDCHPSSSDLSIEADLDSSKASADPTIIFEGAEYEGQHEPLIDPGTWEQVQSVLRANNLAGDKTQTHDHYLKGSLYCGDCESRLFLAHAKNKNGIIYPYFICSGRHRKANDCTRKAMYVDIIEQLIIDHYARIQPRPESVEALKASIAEEFSILTA